MQNGRPAHALPPLVSDLLHSRFPYLQAPDSLRRRLSATPVQLDAAGNQLLGTGRDGLELSISPQSTNNVVAIGRYGRLTAVIDIVGDDNIVLLLGDSRRFGGRIGVRGNGNLFFFGEQASCNAGNFVLVGNGVSICFGNDCMLSQNVSVRASDSHGIVDLESQQIINQPEDILVGHHVWLGYSSTVLKGTRIGSGAIVGAGALVTADVAPCTLAVGAPARPLRQAVSWSRNQNPTAQAIAEIAERAAALPTP